MTEIPLFRRSLQERRRYAEGFRKAIQIRADLREIPQGEAGALLAGLYCGLDLKASGAALEATAEALEASLEDAP